MTEHEQLVVFCERLGASRGQADVMAAQLLRRCEQLVATRGVSRIEAMKYLLELVTRGASGEAPPGFEGVKAKPVDGASPGETVGSSAMEAAVTALFRQTYGRAPEVIARAPGRIEFIGNHTDYNAGTVLGAAVDRNVWVAVAARQDGQRRFLSAAGGGMVTQMGTPQPRQGDEAWTNYPLGVVDAFSAFQLRAPGGFDYVVASDLPAGAGLSSSAAIELSSALAFLEITGQADVSREVLVKIGRHAENHFVGVPCGILDQGVSGFGKADHLVFIDCRGPRFETVPVPSGTAFWIFNTHTKHALVDGLYAARHAECMDAARALGVAFLADADLAQLEARKKDLAPEPYRRARHVLEEIARVSQTREALTRGDLQAVGAALTASHRSSQFQFENSTEELDALVDALVGTPGVYGARLTGGGFGGAVMAFTGMDFSAAAAEAIAVRYAERFGSKPEILHMHTGSGAAVVYRSLPSAS